MSGLDTTDGSLPRGPDSDGHRLEAMRRVIAACDRFEDAWRAGRRPSIEEALAEAPATERATLLRRLLALELEMRRERGEDPHEDEYLERFPNDLSIVQSVIGGTEDLGDLECVALERFAGTLSISPLRVGSDTEVSDLPTLDHSSNVAHDTVSRTLAPHEEATFGAPESRPSPLPERIGRYQVRRLLGEGGFGRVYHAWDADLGRNVAIKVPRAGAMLLQKHADAFVREARLAAGLKHPAIVTVYDIGHDESGAPYAVLEYIEGRSLSDLLRTESVDHRRLAELLAQVAEALHYAHMRGLVHRDLKPANLLVDSHGRPHVADFGLAVHEEVVRTLGRQIAGTLHYMAPEQVRGESHRLDGRTDLWGLGVVLYQMLTGRLPFQGRTRRVAVFDEIVHREPIPPRQIESGVPRELERIAMKCLSKRMTDRYPTALELAADLWFWVNQAGKDEQRLAWGGPVNGRGADRNRSRYSRSSRDFSGLAAPAFGSIPKGLRSFDASDEAFFLALLPGPYDRDGLPASLRFWKTKIESREPNETFTVGLVYGPSGSGKSSLIKAGLLPRLAATIKPVYIEATPDGTEVRLLHGLRKACPDLPEGLPLADVMLALREDPALRGGAKILIVIDQFEQWLHARRSGRGDDLIEALRQTDGVSVQCLVMVRDDFGMAAMRFMNALEVPVVEGKNYALVDRFATLHAADVLGLFGRAFGRLPEEGALTSDQQRFLDQATESMAEDGKVAPVRLALFAEMFRNTPWNPASLKKVGGTEGIGVSFLEQMLGSSATNPRRLSHQQPARAVLKALLPAAGVNIKGHMKPYDELLNVSGYADRPELFQDLLALLDSELRLISPCDPVKSDPDSVHSDVAIMASPVPPSRRSFQLTHDYLVPSLRKWLTQKQSETSRGRAQLLLDDRAAIWCGRPDRCYLPSLLEWLGFEALTCRSDWTTTQTRYMRSATHLSHGPACWPLRSWSPALTVAGMDRGAPPRARTPGARIEGACGQAARFRDRPHASDDRPDGALPRPLAEGDGGRRRRSQPRDRRANARCAGDGPNRAARRSLSCRAFA